MPYVGAAKAARVVRSVRLQVALYLLVAVVSIATGSMAALLWWIGPVVLGMPFLRPYLMAEHTGCSEDDNGLPHPRTTLTAWQAALLMWNMPSHAEHHPHQPPPFPRLPAPPGLIR